MIIYFPIRFHRQNFVFEKSAARASSRNPSFDNQLRCLSVPAGVYLSIDVVTSVLNVSSCCYKNT
jgi:hypothetical protein